MVTGIGMGPISPTNKASLAYIRSRQGLPIIFLELRTR